MNIEDSRVRVPFANISKGDTFYTLQDEGLYMKLVSRPGWLRDDCTDLGFGYAVCLSDGDIYRFPNEEIIVPISSKLIVGCVE